MKKHILSTLLLLSIMVATAQVPISIYQQFLGKYDFIMIGNTMNDHPNTGTDQNCYLLTESSADLTLTPGQTVEAAYLYWAGSGSLAVGDLDILLNGQPVNVDRTFQTFMGVGANNRLFYGAFSDVTSQVLATGNGTYTISEFDLNNVITPSTYCSNGTNFAGWSILIIYHDPATTDNLVNVYDGFRKVDTSEPIVDITLTNLNVLHIVGNKIGFLAWEGDDNIAVDEVVRINDQAISNPPLNFETNVFNGTNSFTNSDVLYNMDIDFFDINDYTNIGDNSLNIRLETGQDVVIMNNMVVVLNTQVPDATISMSPTIGPCDNRDISVDYTVSNLIATDILPANTPISFYADTTLVGSTATINDIPIGGSENGTIILTIPDTLPVNFNLIAKVDDDGAGNSTIIEFNENNNTDGIDIILRFTPIFNEAEPLIICDSNDDGVVQFDLGISGQQIIGGQQFVNINYYETLTAAQNGTPSITTPNNYPNTSANQTIYARLDDGTGCFIIGQFTIQITPPANITHTIPDMMFCKDGPAVTGIPTDLTIQQPFILNGESSDDYTISYHLSETAARQGNNAIPNPDNYPNIQNPQTIWVRMIDNESCVQVGSFILKYNLNPDVTNEVFENCSFTEFTTFHLPNINSQVVSNPTGLDFTYFLTFDNAEDNIDPLPQDYTNIAPNQIIFVRVETSDGCYSIAEVTLTTIILHEEIENLIQQCDDPKKINDERSIFDLTSMNLTVTNALGGTNYTITYHTSIENAQTGTGTISNPIEFINTSNPQTIYARATGGDGSCGGTAEFVIEVLPVPEFDLPEYLAFCDYDEPNYDFNENFETYIWRDSSGEIISNSSYVEFDNEGIYTLQVTSDVNDCPAIRDVEVIFDHKPVITNIEVDGNIVSVYPTGGYGPYQYSYNNGLTWHDYFMLQDVPSGVHYMMVKTLYGCISEAKIFGVLGIPNVITPNGDGYNDYWEIRALEMYPDAYIKIFDRYGKIFVDRKMGENFRWDGQYMGRPLPSGDYWYIITIEGQSISGHITVRNR